INLIAGAAIPSMLMAFGISLVGSRPLDKKHGRRRDTLLASAVKLLIHPVAAWLLSAYAFQLDTEGILVATVLASLPTAPNVFVSASRYDPGVVAARAPVPLATILPSPAMIAVAGLLAETHRHTDEGNNGVQTMRKTAGFSTAEFLGARRRGTLGTCRSGHRSSQCNGV